MEARKHLIELEEEVVEWLKTPTEALYLRIRSYGRARLVTFFYLRTLLPEGTVSLGEDYVQVARELN